jgi:hypothetical protein
MAIFERLWQFGIYFFRSGLFYQEKSGNPVPRYNLDINISDRQNVVYNVPISTSK